MKTVAQVSRLTGISVRTLHHYDAIGLLKPSRIRDAGYRLYDETALKRLQTILLFRELEFPLKQIKVILESAEFDPMEALTDQIRMLELKREHLDQVIAHARNIQETGVISMNFKEFDTKKMDSYAAQAKEKWGNTDAYRESQQKAAGKTKEQQMETAAELMDIFRQMGQIRQSDPAGAEALEMVQKLQAFITEHYYNCTKQILMGLGQMYAAGGEMTDNINNAGGEGTAQFAGEAIVHDCK